MSIPPIEGHRLPVDTQCEHMPARFLLPQRVNTGGWHCHVSVRARSQACARGEAGTAIFMAAFVNGLCYLDEPSPVITEFT